MSIIEHNLLPKQKSRKSNLKVKVDLYAYATELYNELYSLGIIDRISSIPQLGVIKVQKSLKKSRYDYTILQLYFHQLIKKELQPTLKYTYNNPVKAKEFGENINCLAKNERLTVGDILQILSLVYSIGHFYNTFTASRAIVMLANEDNAFYKKLVNNSQTERFQNTVKKIITERNYQRFHLLNSLLVLERCNQNKISVLLAQEILYAYINKDTIPIDSKLHYVFEIFRNVRSVSYIAYDLQIANTPFTIDLWNDDAILLLFRELLSNYNDQQPAHYLINSISKLLDDSVYNENSSAICYYIISRKMVSSLKSNRDLYKMDYYMDLWCNTESILNIQYRQSRDYSNEAILKLTFDAIDKQLSQELLDELEHTNHVRIGYYDRHSGERTVLVSIKKTCTNKPIVALRILKSVINIIKNVSVHQSSDVRYLLASKFFIFYLFLENSIVIEPTIDKDICVLCTRGRNSRITEIKKLLEAGGGTEDEQHEVNFLVNCLEMDKKNDTTITIPASILVYRQDSPGKKLCEFDGMIIHPNRKSSQVILMEAKNTSTTPSYGKKCLCEKLDKIGYVYNKDSIEIKDYDAHLSLSVY
ncbi:hypothetical protein [Proteiniborus sp. MB09-C3]|uniref:hypothetical protein n=1 Tax=Proteiniborus sp. MB09-C3 TaxID=3050072 RepID=UPI0025560CC5|nr:hypothetical protein [Proteiniborus sp. MB09-C3]WIV13606.1 hypothetical protein QO263_07855 [Proteiniborus sp. MB09-C3]